MTIIIKKSAKKKEIDKLLKTANKPKVTGILDASKYCGVIKLRIDPADIQRQMRNEWK